MDDHEGRSNISISVGGDNTGSISAGNTYNSLDEAGLRPELDPQTAAQKLRLFNVLAAKFSADELRELCLELGLDYDDLAGDGKRSKALALVEFQTRRDQLPALEERLRVLRPAAFP